MNIIYVDDEKIQLTNFKLTAKGLARIDSLETFNSSSAALEWAKTHQVDVAFLDVEMPGINGIELARLLKELDENIKIVFVTAYEQYALEAFGVDAIGYLLKPYSGEDIEKELRKAYYVREIPKKKIQIYTMPNFVIMVDGKQLMLGHNKQEELLMLLVDRGEEGLTKKDAINNLWNGNASDSIYWITTSRLKNILDEAGISDLVVTNGQTKYINMDIVDCDLYRMLERDGEAIRNYHGKYLEIYSGEYSWIRKRKEQLDAIKAGEEKR